MKKLSKLFVAFATAAALLLASCSDVDTDSSGTMSSGVNDLTNNEKDYSVSFVAADGTAVDFSTLVDTASGSERTIVATEQDLSGYHYYLWGTNLVTNDTVDPKEVTFTADGADTTKGSVTLDLSVANYKLVLAAVANTFSFAAGTTTGENIKAAALYVGYANVDLRNTNSIKFYITSEGLTGDAEFELSIMYDGLKGASGTWLENHKNLVQESTNYTIGAYIEKRTDGSLVYPSGDEKPLSNIDNAKFFTGTGDDIAKLSGTATPGTYNLVVAFKCIKSKKIYYWSDTIILLPKQKVTADVKVPDVIEYAPAAPQNLKIGYVTPSTSDIGTYTAVAKWEDKSSNETHFQIEIVDVSSKVGTEDSAGISTITTAVTADAGWSTAVESITETSKTTYAKDFYGDSKNGWVAGSLQKNNTYVAFRLSLGTTYLVRIAAVNDAGTSDYAYATYDLSETWSDTDANHTASYSANPFAIKNIAIPFSAAEVASVYAAAATPTYCVTANLFRLTYHLNGGTLTVASDKTTTADCVYYLSEDPTTGLSILSPYNSVVAAGGTQAYPMLINAGNKWTSWRTDIVEGPKYDSEADNTTVTGFTFYAPKVYKKFKNLDLYASYTVASADVEAYLDKNYNFQTGEVTLTTGGSVIRVTDNAYTVYTTSNVTGITAASEISVNYALTTSRTEFTYSSLFATITRNGKSYAKKDFASGACTLNVKNLPADGAVYQLTVVGEYKGHQYTYPITLTLQDAVAANP